MKNKAGYTATQVANKWAGAMITIIKYLSRGSDAKTAQNAEKAKCYGPTNKPPIPSDRQSGL